MAGSAPATNVGGPNFPQGCDNGTDIWEDSGVTTVLTAPLAGLVAGSPVRVIAATTGKKIRVIGFDFTASAVGSVQFQDEAGTPNLLSGVYTTTLGGSIVRAPNKYGYMDTLAGAALDIAIVGTSQVIGGTIQYCLH